jgi:hypothetical protein
LADLIDVCRIVKLSFFKWFYAGICCLYLFFLLLEWCSFGGFAPMLSLASLCFFPQWIVGHGTYCAGMSEG